tara:strand:+ start:635 stop:1363 length:729 start_codon:yes stop_codon:yes gene_type:complete
MAKQRICKNKICVNNKTIKLGTMKAKKMIQIERNKKQRQRQQSSHRRTKKRLKKEWSDSKILKKKIYFYNIDENVSYDTHKKSTWSRNKDKKGFLYLASYNSFIYEHNPNKFVIRTKGPNIMIFSKTNKKEIEDDPQWAYISGITIQKPYSFGLSANHLSHTSHLKFTNQIIDKPIIKNSKPKISDFNEFIKNKEDMLQNKNLLKEFEFSKPYIAKYSDLLQTFYKKSSFGNHDIFGIVKWA